MSTDYVITLASPEHLAALPGVELDAATRFDSWLVPPSMFTEATAMDRLAAAQAEGYLWVGLTAAGRPVAFALASSSGARLYLEELDVATDHAGRGLGLALIAEVERKAAADGAVEIALTTYRDVPWNAPFYLRHGFEFADAVDAELSARLRDEAARGLDSMPRVGLRKPVNCRATETELPRYYAARASEYDRIYQKPERQADLAELRRWLPARFAGAHLLEVACGTGYWTQYVAPVAASVVAIDAAPETLEIARSRPANASVRFHVADAYQLPSDLGSFDAALAAFWLSHVPIARRREFLTGLSAVLSPGARVVLLDNRFVPGSNTPFSERDAGGNTYQLRTLGDCSEHRVLKDFPTEEELRGCLTGIGEGVSYTAWEYYWAVEYRTQGMG